MKRYFIDTCVLIWLIEGSKRVKNILYDIEYYQGDYAVSIEVLTEFINLLSARNIRFDINDEQLIKKLDDSRIGIYNFEKKHIKQLFELPYFEEHKNQYDRNIVAHAIADNRILISGDDNFHLYEDYGLKFLEI
jgi:PIN domain nuclease of toxin-antitoxin system